MTGGVIVELQYKTLLESRTMQKLFYFLHTVRFSLLYLLLFKSNATEFLHFPLSATHVARARPEPSLGLLLADGASTSALAASQVSDATRFEALVARRSCPTRALEFDASRFAPALLSRRALLKSRGLAENDVPIDVVDLVRLRWSSAPPTTRPIHVHINFERGVPVNE